MTSTTSPSVRLSAHANCEHPATKAYRAICRRDHRTPTDLGYAFKSGHRPNTQPGLRFVILNVNPTATGWAFHTNTLRSLLAFAKSPTKYATSVKGPTGDYFETRSFLDAPVN